MALLQRTIKFHRALSQSHSSHEYIALQKSGGAAYVPAVAANEAAFTPYEMEMKSLDRNSARMNHDGTFGVVDCLSDRGVNDIGLKRGQIRAVVRRAA